MIGSEESFGLSDVLVKAGCLSTVVSRLKRGLVYETAFSRFTRRQLVDTSPRPPDVTDRICNRKSW